MVEKESGLRQALTNVGMMDSSFWLSWGFTEMVAGVLFSLLIIAFGAAFQFAFFLKNSFGILFLLFFLFQWAMTSVAFIFSTFIARSSNAVYVGFVIFIIGWICQVVIAFGFPYTPSEVHSVPALTVIFALLPWSLLAKASSDLGAASTAAGTQGISWSNRGAYCQDIQNPAQQSAAYVPGVYQDFNCVLSVQTVLVFLTLEAIAYFFIALYLDNILANNHGVRKKPWYFLQPSYWMHGRSKGIPESPAAGRRATWWCAWVGRGEPEGLPVLPAPPPARRRVMKPLRHTPSQAIWKVACGRSAADGSQRPQRRDLGGPRPGRRAGGVSHERSAGAPQRCDDSGGWGGKGGRGEGGLTWEGRRGQTEEREEGSRC